MGFFKELFGIIEVKEENGYIEVSGLRAKRMVNYLTRDIDRYFEKSTRVSNNVFIFSKTGFKFLPFFGPDVLFVFERLINTKGNRVPKRTLAKIFQSRSFE